MNSNLDGRIRRFGARLHPYFISLSRASNYNLAPAVFNTQSSGCKKCNYVLIRIPKAASQTVLLNFAESDPHMVVENRSFEPGLRPSVYGYLRQGFVDLMSFLPPINHNCRDIKFVTFVRNPYERFLSGFFGRVLRSTAEQVLGSMPVSEVKRLMHLTLDRTMNWYKGSDKHFLPQVAFLPVEISAFTFVGRFETLKEDLATGIFQAIGIKREVGLNADSHRTNSKQAIFLLEDKDIQNKIYEIYAEDFEVLNYSRDLG